jgi:RNA polymerase sigma factor (TIGR02999 family)
MMTTPRSSGASALADPAPPLPSDFDQLFALFYEELREIARLHLRRERDDHTLQTTALVHEAYVKLSARPEIEWREPARFRAFVSKAMRHVLIDHARSRATDKRGGGAIHVTLVPGLDATQPEASVDLLDLDRALEQLGAFDERLVQVVECRFFGGLTAQETADTLEISTSTVERDWTRARVYLRRLLAPHPATG